MVDKIDAESWMPTPKRFKAKKEVDIKEPHINPAAQEESELDFESRKQAHAQKIAELGGKQ